MPKKSHQSAQAAPTTRRAALYPRVSDPYGDKKRTPTTERQQETPLDQQESACRAYAEQRVGRDVQRLGEAGDSR